VCVANVLEIVEPYDQSGPDAKFLGIIHLVLAVCLAGLGAMYVVRDVRVSRNRRG
jgi:hypothetical protein